MQSFSGHLNDSQASITYQVLLCAKHMLCFLASMHGNDLASTNGKMEFWFTLQGLHHTFIQQIKVTLQGDVPVT